MTWVIVAGVAIGASLGGIKGAIGHDKGGEWGRDIGLGAILGGVSGGVGGLGGAMPALGGGMTGGGGSAIGFGAAPEIGGETVAGPLMENAGFFSTPLGAAQSGTFGLGDIGAMIQKPFSGMSLTDAAKLAQTLPGMLGGGQKTAPAAPPTQEPQPKTGAYQPPDVSRFLTPIPNFSTAGAQNDQLAMLMKLLQRSRSIG